MEGAALSI